MIHGASVNVLDYGADSTGSTDSTAAIQAAVNAHNGYVSIYFPAGTYKITSTITFAYDRYFVYGDGVASKINFVPTANDDCFLFDKGSTATVQNTVRDLAFYSDDTTYDKRAISLVDVSSSLIENVHTIYPHWSGGSNYSTFLWIQGRDITAIRGLNVSADVPIRISPIPAPHTAGGIGIDHFHFSDCYLICSKATKSCVQIDSDVNLTQVTFDGYQAWIGGSYGLYWVDTASATTSNGLILSNVRYEQGTDPTKWLAYISHNTSLQGFSVIGGQGGDRNGFYLRKVNKILFESFYYTSSSLVAIDADTTVDDITMVNCFWQAGSTSSLTGHDLAYSSPKNPNTGPFPPSAAYCLTSNAAQMYAGRLYTPTVTRNGFTETPGSGSITTTAAYVVTGKLCTFVITTVCSGGATIASVLNSSYYSGLPNAASNKGVCYSVCATDNSISGISLVENAAIYTTAWAALANKTYVTSGSYLTS